MLTSLSTLDLDVKPDWTNAVTVTYARRMASDDPIRKSVGERLQVARDRVGMTQQFVADAFEVGKGTVSAWETGGGDPGIYRLRRLAKMYETTADALLWDDAPTSEAQNIARGYDAFNADQRRKFDNMWRAHFAQTATDKDVADDSKEQPGGKYRVPDPVVADTKATTKATKAKKKGARKASK